MQYVQKQTQKLTNAYTLRLVLPMDALFHSSKRVCLGVWTARLSMMYPTDEF